MRISPHIIQGTISSKTHAQDIYPTLVNCIMSFCPLQQFINFFWAPCPSTILRSQYNSRYHLTFFNGIKYPICTNSVQVVSTKACAMKEYNKARAAEITT